MFGSFFNLLYPAQKFLTSVLNMLKYNPSTYDIDELTEQMNENEECELKDGSLDINELNKKLKLKNFLINNFSIEKSIFVFKRNYMGEKTIISLEGVNIDIFNKIENEEKKNILNGGDNEKKKSEGGLLENIINVVVHNLEVNFKNIKIRFYDKENKNVEYTFFIKNISYKENPNVEPIRPDEKIKYLFVHNKAVYIEGILLKEKYAEEDNIFFSNNEEDKENKNKFISKNNNLFYIKNKIEIDMFFDKDNNNLTISNNNNSEFYIENFFNINQFNSLFNYFIHENKKNDIEINKQNDNNDNNNNIINNDDNNEKKEDEKKEDDKKEDEKKGINLMGFKIAKINFDIKNYLFYFILMNDDNKNNDKKWVSQIDNLNNSNDMLNSCIEYFNDYKKQYYILCANDVLFKSKEKQISINDISLKLISSSNINNNDNNNINNINELNNGLEQKSIININKFKYNLEEKELSYKNIYLEICPNLIHYLNKFPNSSQNINKNNIENTSSNELIQKEINNLDNIISNDNQDNKISNDNKDNIISNDNQDNIISTNTNQIEEQKKLFKMCGEKFNLKIFINNNIKENISFNEVFNNEEYDYIDFVIDNFNLNLNNEEISNLYDKINISYNTTENKTYPLLQIIEHKNSPECQNTKIVNNQNEILIDLEFQILLFINPKILKNVLTNINYISQVLKNKTSNNNKKNKKDKKDNNINLNKEDNCCMKKNMNLKLNEIKIFLLSEEETHLNIHKIFTDLPQNTIEYRKNNNYLCINLTEIGAKLECNENNKKCNLYLRSLVVEDNIKHSKYKILFSNYNFKNKEEILLNCDLEIQKQQNKNQYIIKPTIKIAPIAIYLDQISLYYIFNIFNQIKDKKKNENEKKDEKVKNEKKNEDIKNINNKNDKYIISNTFIENFFLQLNYKSNSEVKDNEFLKKTIILLLNNISLQNLNINLNDYKNENNNLTPKEAIKNIYEFYSNEIINQMKNGSLVTALPLINHITSVIDGTLDIVREPVQKYKQNESVMDGFVQGISSCVVNTATMFTYIGESITSYFNILGCYPRGENDDENMNFCRSVRYKFNERNKEIEEYYFK